MKHKYSKDMLEPIVKRNKTIAGVLRDLGLVPKGDMYRVIRKYILKFNIDVSHFTGQHWAKGLTKEMHEAINFVAEKNTKHTAKTSLIDGIALTTRCINRLLKEIKIEYKCKDCGNEGLHNGKKLVLQVDHINGSNIDNRAENLRYLCPNCHSQTDTYGTKNLKNKNKKVKDAFFCQPLVTIKSEFIKEKNQKSLCPVCNKETVYTFCSQECFHFSLKKIKMSDKEVYDIWIENNKNFLKTARIVGVSDNAVRKKVLKFC